MITAVILFAGCQKALWALWQAGGYSASEI